MLERSSGVDVIMCDDEREKRKVLTTEERYGYDDLDPRGQLIQGKSCSQEKGMGMLTWILEVETDTRHSD